jgi:hypothetical protein
LFSLGTFGFWAPAGVLSVLVLRLVRVWCADIQQKLEDDKRKCDPAVCLLTLLTESDLW